MLENNCVDDSFPTVLYVFLTSNCTETEFLYPFRILELNLLSFSGVMSFLQYFVKYPPPIMRIQILSLICWWRASLFVPRTNRTKSYDKLSSLDFIFISSYLSWLKLCFILLQIFLFFIFFWGGGGGFFVFFFFVFNFVSIQFMVVTRLFVVVWFFCIFLFFFFCLGGGGVFCVFITWQLNSEATQSIVVTRLCVLCEVFLEIPPWESPAPSFANTLKFQTSLVLSLFLITIPVSQACVLLEFTFHVRQTMFKCLHHPPETWPSVPLLPSLALFLVFSF